MKIFIKKTSISKFILIGLLFILSSCALNTGINENPIEANKSKNIYTPNIKIKIQDINELTFDDINKTNNNYVENIVQDSAIKEFYGLYDYVYEYQLGPGDEIVINLTETDDIDGNYLIDPFGMIDLPYVGKINVKDLTSTEVQNILLNILKKFYKNPDLQIDIVAFNSS